jgi:hypothetical protein
VQMNLEVDGQPYLGPTADLDLDPSDFTPSGARRRPRARNIGRLMQPSFESLCVGLIGAESQEVHHLREGI